MTVWTPEPLALAAPEERDDELRHDATFERWDRRLSELRDVVNGGIRALNHLGAGIAELPGGSLEDLLVLPLTGDPVAIRQNADGAHVTAEAMRQLAEDLGRLTADVDLWWGGRAATAFLVRLGGRAAGGIALAAAFDGGAAVLDEVADFCERLGVEVEHLVVTLGEALERLARRVLSRLNGPVGGAALAADLAIHGLHAITDIVDDVRTVVETIERFGELRDEVHDWAVGMRDRLDALHDLVDLLPR